MELSLEAESGESIGAMKSAPAPMAMKEMREVRRMKKADDGGAAGDKGLFFSQPRQRERESARQFFRKLDKTKEWAENNYYHLPIESQNADLISVNPFWNDYAEWVRSQESEGRSQKAFISRNFIYATRNFAEMMLALSVLDLPLKAEKHESSVQGIRFELKAGNPMIVFHKEIKPAVSAEEKVPILISQHLFNPNDRYRYADNERFDKYIEDEFLVHTPFGCQFVLSNPTSSRHKLSILLQIPHGAMPLNKGFYTKSIPITLEPYATQNFEYLFYFPETGKFGHYPVQAAKNEAFIAGASGITLNVVANLSKTDTESWDYISQNGSEKEVLEFLKENNLNRLNLDKIAFRMQNKEFFKSVISLLKDRHFYHHTLWSYSIYHNEPKIISEYLANSDYANQCGLYIKSALLTVDPVARKTYQHLEYKPMVNAHASIGKR